MPTCSLSDLALSYGWELIVESAGTINTEVGQALTKTPPSDYHSSFCALVHAGWIAQELAEWAKLRNALVHRYDTVKTKEFTQMLADGIGPWRAYLAAISEHI